MTIGPLSIFPHTAIMSIEYTIDIQLTELGFPDILQSQETPVREAARRSTSDGSFSPSRTPTLLSTTGKQRLLVKGRESVDEERAGAEKQTSDIQQTTGDSPVPESLPFKPVNPAQSLQDDQSVKVAVSEESKPAADDATAGLKSTDDSQLMTAGEENGQKDNGDRDMEKEGSAEMEQDVEDDSDDSEVSEVYEEEEVDEDDEDEEGLDDGMTHSP